MRSKHSFFHHSLIWLTCISLLTLNIPPQNVVAQSSSESDSGSDATTSKVYLPVVANGGGSNATPPPTFTYTATPATPKPPLTATPISTPAPSDGAGWVSGVVYDSTNCGQFLTQCKALSGAKITLAAINKVKLAQVRAARKSAIVASGYTDLLRPSKNLGITTPITGVVTTDADGAFNFPVAKSGSYWLRIEKDGFTYAQRQIEVVSGRSTATNAILLTPLDAKVTDCTTAGCTHSNSDNSIQLLIPAGAIPNGETVKVTATNYKQAEFLPSGELPEGTWETYAFNLGGDSEYEFQPGANATVRIKNDKGFAPGTSVPLGYWNQATQAWEHSGTGEVDASGTWIEMKIVHFSNYDCNDPISEPDADIDATPMTGNNQPICQVPPTSDPGVSTAPAGEGGCFIGYKSGTLQEWIDLPPVQLLGEETSPQLRYSTERVNPSALIDVDLTLNSINAAEIGKYIGWELYIEGSKTKNFTFAAGLQNGGSIGRYRYLWDGKNAQGKQMPSGVYEYQVKLSIPYKGQYCYALDGIFGNPPDCVNGATGRFVDAVKDVWVKGTVLLNDQSQSSLGAGWALADQQHLYRSDNGRILVSDGRQMDEFLGLYVQPGTDLRLSSAQSNGVLASDISSVPTNIQPAEDSLAQATQSDIQSLPDIPDGNSEPMEAQRPEAIVVNQSVESTDEPLLQQEVRSYFEEKLATSTNVCGSLSTNTTWTTANSPYVMTCNVSVPANVTLAIQPGVIVKSGENVNLYVYGTLSLQGTAAQPVVFTSIKDDSRGGDTNGDGATTTPAAGDWGGIDMLTDSANLSNLTLVYSDYGLFFDNLSTGTSVTLQNNTFSQNAQQAVMLDLYYASGQITASGNNATGNGTNGMVIRGNAAGALALNWQLEPKVPLVLNIYNLSVDSDGVLTLAPGTLVKASSNTALTVSGRLVSQGTAAQPVVFTSIKDDTRGGDTNNDGTATSPAPKDWGGLYLLTDIASVSYVTIAYSDYGLFFENVQAGSDITIQNNTFLNNFSQSVRLDFYYGGGKVTASGNVVTNNGVNGTVLYGQVSSPLTLNWQAESKMPLVITAYDFAVQPEGALTLSPGTLIKSAQYADLLLQGKLVSQGTASQPVVLTSLKDDSRGGDTNNDGTATTAAPKDWEGIYVYADVANISNLTIANSSYGINFDNLAAGTDVTIQNNVFQNNFSQAVILDLYYTSGKIKASGNSGLKNGMNGMVIRGYVSGALTLDWQAEPKLPLILTYYTLSIQKEGTLTLSPGTLFKADQNISVYVYGGLVSQGTIAQPVVFTSLKDDARGGDTNNDGNATTAATRDWNGIIVYASVSAIRNLTLAYSESGLFFENVGANSDIVVENNQFINNYYQAFALDFYFAGGKIRANGNTSVGSTGNGTYMRGTVSSDLTLDWQAEQALPLIVNNYALTIREGASMTLTAGSIVKATKDAVIYVYGNLVSQGTAAQPVIFTSFKDDTRGGDTNGDSSNSTPAPGDWSGIYFYSHDQKRIIKYFQVDYAERALYFYSMGSNIDLTVRDNIFAHNNYAPIDLNLYNADGQIAIFDNIATNNELDAVGIAGSVNGALSLDSGTLTDLPWSLYSDLSVNTSGTLILSPGMVLKGSRPSSADNILVYGTLIAEGNPNEPIVFTSIKDTVFGNVSLNDTTPPAPNDWGGIYFYNGSKGNSLRNCVIAYAYRDISTAVSDLSIAGCTIQASQNAGIYVESNIEFALAGNSFAGNASHAIYNAGNKTIDARYNWWGDASGPLHPTLNSTGKGDRVSDRVSFDPWSLSAGEAVLAMTAADHSRLLFDPDSDSYTRIYPNGKQIHFNANGTHSYTVEPDGRKTSYSYNADGTLASLGITPPAGTAPKWLWTFSYANGELSTIKDPANRITTFTINNNGELAEVTLPDQSKRKFVYDTRHLLTQYTDQNNAITDYAYDSSGRITKVTDPTRSVFNPTTGTVESKREVRTFTPSETGYTLINSSAVGDPASPAPSVPTSNELVDKVTYGRGQRTGHTNSYGSWLDTTDGINRITTYERDAANNVTLQIDPNGECVSYTYDRNGNRLTKTLFPAVSCSANGQVTASVGLGQTWKYSYESRFNQLKTVTDPLGQVTTYFYDYEENKGTVGNLIRIDFPDVRNEIGGVVSPKMTFTYNALGLLETETNLQGIVTKYLYSKGSADEANGAANARFAAGASPVPGLLIQMIEDFGDATHLNLITDFRDIDAQGNPLTVTDPRGNKNRVTYDAFGRVQTFSDPLGEVTKYEYDGRGNLLRQTVGYTADGTSGRNLITQFSYDGNDHLLSQRTDADSQVHAMTLSYDINGELATYKNSEGQTITYGYDAADQLTRITNPLNQTTQLSYDGRSQLAKVQLANSNTISFTYDAFGNLASLTPPGRQPHLFDYTGRNETATYRPPALNTGATNTTYSYDAFGQLLSFKRPDDKIVSLTYDGVQRLNKVAFSRGQLSFAYHPATSQLTAINAPDSVNLTYGYDRERLTSTTWSGPVAGAVKYSYDANGRITGIALNNSAAVAFQYDISDFLTKAGDLNIQRLRQSRQLQSTTLGTVNDSWSYDGFGKVTGYQAKNGATVLYSVQYSYDKLNRIASKIETIQGSTITWNYGYDAVGQLTEVKRNGTVTERYSYDANGNRLTALNGITASYDSQDRLLQYATATYSYTLNGERFGKIDGGQTTLYRYDELSNLTAISLPNGSLFEYLIDGQNRRIGKKVNGILVQGWLYEDQLRPVAEIDGTGAVVSRFVYGDRINVPEYMVKGGVTYRFVLDHLGSVRLVVNSQTGEVVQRMDYDAWGVVTQDTNPGFQPFGFAGGLWDGQTGLVRFGARDYDAKVGRWTSKDPIGFEGDSSNIYTYVVNNPRNHIDSSGLGFWGKRPLEAWPWITTSPQDDAGNTGLYHEHFFFDDCFFGVATCTNVGKFDDGIHSDDPSNLEKYKFDPEWYDDDIIRQAMKNLNFLPYSLLPFDLSSENCQEWAERVRQEYKRIMFCKLFSGPQCKHSPALR